MLSPPSSQTFASVEVAFDQYQYGSTSIPNPADGISFFLVDGSGGLTAPGAFGGSLGYAQKQPDGDPSRPFIPGVDNGYLGIGLDVLGGYFGDWERRGEDCDERSPSGTAWPVHRRPPHRRRHRASLRPLAMLELVKHADTDRVHRPGDKVKYTYTVTNTTGVDVPDIRVVDDRIRDVTCESTGLTPAGSDGDSTTCTATEDEVTIKVTAEPRPHLAVTGTPSAWTAATGVALLAVGVLLVTAARRRFDVS